jgi:hypothetical protein
MDLASMAFYLSITYLAAGATANPESSAAAGNRTERPTGFSSDENLVNRSGRGGR